jgi:hypothetical protein
MSITALDIVGNKAKRNGIIPYLVEVTLKEPSSSSFLQVRETLTRLGISVSKKDEPSTLYQTCHILTKRGKHYIVHFKSMFILDGRNNDLTEADIARQNLIIQLLEDWGLVTVVVPEMVDSPVCSMSSIKVISHQEKKDWKLATKYNIGSYKKVFYD